MGNYPEQLAQLPDDWKPERGLEYPTSLFTVSGEEIEIECYEDHHRLIKNLFRPEGRRTA